MPLYRCSDGVGGRHASGENVDRAAGVCRSARVDAAGFVGGPRRGELLDSRILREPRRGASAARSLNRFDALSHVRRRRRPVARAKEFTIQGISGVVAGGVRASLWGAARIIETPG